MSKNIYYHPEHYDLIVIDELENGGNFEFDTTVVWLHKDGRILWAHSSGCSCPDPFEEYHTLKDLNEICPPYMENIEAMIHIIGKGGREFAMGIISKIKKIKEKS